MNAVDQGSLEHSVRAKNALWMGLFIAGISALGLMSTSSLASDAPQKDAVADPVRTPSLADSNTIAAIESDIRSKDFNRRQQAMLQLWGGRDRYREWVEKAASDSDPEVASRATWVLDRWRRGLLPDTPREVAERLESANGPDSIEDLLNAGLFTGALVAIDEAISGASSPAIIDRAASAVRRRFPFFVRIAVQRSEVPQFVSVLDRLALDAPTAMAFQQLNRLVNGADRNELPSSSKRWTEAQRNRIQVILHAANNELPQAVAIAEASGDRELIRVCRMLSSDWSRMAKEQAEAAKSQTPDSVAWYRHWMYAMMASSRSFKSDPADNTPESIAALAAIRTEAVERLSESRGEESDGDVQDPINRIRWQSLAMHGELDRASQILKKLQPTDAAELLAQAGRHTEAFAAVGVDWLDLDAELSKLVSEAIRGERKQATMNGEQGSPALVKLLTVVRLLVHVGRDDLAFQSLMTVVNDPSLRSVPHDPTQIHQEYGAITRIEIMRTLARMNRTEWVSKLLVSPTDTTLSGRTQFFLAMIFDAENQTVAALMEAITRLKPEESFADHVRDTITLLGGSLPDGFDADKDFRELFNTMAAKRPLGRADGRGIVLSRGARLTLDMVRFFELHNQPQLAKETLLALAQSGEDEAKLKLASSELNEGSVAIAREAFETVWKTVELSGRSLTRLNQADSDALIAMKAIQGEAIAARRIGDNEGADQLDRQIQMMSCTPSAALRNSFAEHLVELGHLDQAEAIYRPLLQMVAFGSEEGVEFYTIARNFDSAVAETSPAASAAALDLAVAGTIETTVFYPAAYVSLPSYVHRRLVRNAVEQQDETAVRRHVDQLLRLDPIDIDFGEKVLESMRSKGMEKLADEVLERIYQAGNSHLQNFPLDRGMANNLAWVMALSDFRLEEALRFSTRAVLYEPNSTVYRDTMAEVLFRLGRVKEAIAIEKSCLLDDPSEWHVHEQIRRFESGDRSSKPSQTSL